MDTAERKLYQIAENQMGYFTAKQAIAAGYLAKNHAYHLNQGHWIREFRSIYRLAHFPISPEGEWALWTLWSRNRKDIPQGVFSHESALSIYDISDAMPARLHMTVPKKFRKSASIPPVLFLHYDDLSADDIQTRSGYAVTKPFRTIQDLAKEKSTSEDILNQAIQQFRDRGLLTERELIQLVEMHPSLAKHIFSSQRNGKKG